MVGATEVGEPAEQIMRYAELGCDHLIVHFADLPRLDGAMRFVEQVLPRLKEASRHR